MCQDYMSSISNTIDPRVLRQSGINLVIISNGSYNMIKSYRRKPGTFLFVSESGLMILLRDLPDVLRRVY